MSGERKPGERIADAPIDELRRIVARLRAPGGCPWDREQTHASLRAGLIEEAYEVVRAIDAAVDDHLREELGDLLLQVVFHAQIATEEQRFTFDDVADVVAEKLVRRHPHVFGDAHCADAAAVLKRWDEIKRAEKGRSGSSAIDDLDPALPALMCAQQTQKKAARVGFDWNNAQPVFEKLREEIAEIEGALAAADASGTLATKQIEDELGDLLFSVVNLARKLQIDAEIALRGATDKFLSRFRAMERLAAQRKLDLQKMTLSQMDTLWDEVKRAE